MIKKFISGYMPPYGDVKGNIVTDSVSALEKIMLGGVEQWYTIRGRSKKTATFIIFTRCAWKSANWGTKKV